MISVVIPLYNKEKQIVKTLQSVFAQTYTDYEIVIVNDGSTDRSADVVESINAPRIRLIHQHNAGVSAARNLGISEACGDYIAFLDADDEWKPTYLETIIQLINKYPHCYVFAANYEFRNSKEKVTPTIFRHLPFSGSDGILTNYFEVAATSHPPLWTSAVVVKKSAFESVGGFPIGIKSGEDLLTWARLAHRYSIAYSILPQAIYNLGEGYDFSKLPPRRQDIGDPVGIELKRLYNDKPYTPGFRQYIAHWHKMRASVALRYGDIKETLLESHRSLKYNPLNYKVLPFIILAITPSFIRKKIISLRNYI